MACGTEQTKIRRNEPKNREGRVKKGIARHSPVFMFLIG